MSASEPVPSSREFTFVGIAYGLQSGLFWNRRDGRTLAREAYFLEFAREIRALASMPVMVTGGIRRLPVVEQVLASGVAMAGIATALAINPALP